MALDGGLGRGPTHPAPVSVNLDLPGEPAAETRLSSGLFQYCLTRASGTPKASDGSVERASLLGCGAAPDAELLLIRHRPVEAHR